MAATSPCFSSNEAGRLLELAGDLARPFWAETLDQRISNHWERMLIGLRDAGIQATNDEQPEALAKRVAHRRQARARPRRRLAEGGLRRPHGVQRHRGPGNDFERTSQIASVITADNMVPDWREPLRYPDVTAH
jgi:hypothetical protein